MSEAARSGRYVTQLKGYRAFIPNELPPEPPVEIDQEMWMLLSQADRALGRLDGATEALPNPDLFVFMYVRKEAVLSSQIEGTQASLIDVLEFESQTLEPENPQDIEEVVNYISAVNYGLDRLSTLPVSMRLIREIHEKLMEGVRGGDREPGQLRTSQNWIGPSNCTLSEASYVPPPPQEMIRLLSNLESFIHTGPPMPALIKVGLAHSQFETIHPFLDGNGRTGRLLITFLLCEQEILRYPLLYLSYYFKKYRSEYYAQLQSVRDNGTWEAWIKFFLRGVYEVAQEASATARKIVAMKEEHRQLVLQQVGPRRAGNAIALLESLYFKPVFSVSHVESVTGLSYTNANALVSDLNEIGLLQEITGRVRNRAFAYAPYLDVFSDEV